MKNDEYLIVHKSILPDYYDLVITARDLINGQKYSVSDACKKVNISRSTFYKYKDYVFRPVSLITNKAIFDIKVMDEKGILSLILGIISNENGNVISINQTSPIDGLAHITISLDINELNVSLDALKNKISELDGVKYVDILGVE